MKTVFSRFVSRFSKSTIQQQEQSEIAILEDVGKLVHRSINASLIVNKNVKFHILPLN
jgi:hypothetical protein